MLNDFILLLKDYGLEISLKYVMDFNRGLEKKLVGNLDELFLFARLCFVKKPKDLDTFERAFALYFYNIDIPRVAEGDPELLDTPQFREWLKKAWEEGKFDKHPNFMPREELIKKFWDTVREQMGEHHGGSKWVGTGGSSPFGHSGAPQPGVRVFGGSRNFSALKVIDDRRYIDYSGARRLDNENIRQALEALKNLQPAGAHDILDIDKTIDSTARNGGEIELIFEQDKLDRLDVILMIDNGGFSMHPFIEVTRKLFSKMKNQFKRLRTYYFHNTIYGHIYKDAARRQPISLHKIMESDPETRVFIMGDASMAPDELLSAFGSISMQYEEYESSMEWLQRLADRFEHTVWLNPIPRENWQHAYGRFTISRIGDVFHMQDTSLDGIRKAVEYMNTRSTG